MVWRHAWSVVAAESQARVAWAGVAETKLWMCLFEAAEMMGWMDCLDVEESALWAFPAIQRGTVGRGLEAVSPFVVASRKGMFDLVRVLVCSLLWDAMINAVRLGWLQCFERIDVVTMLKFKYYARNS